MGRILHLKTLSSIPMTIGTGVHDILATVLTPAAEERPGPG